MPNLTRRLLLQQLAWAAASGLTVDAAEAACLKADVVRWIIPNAIGGGYDSYSRLLQPYLERELGVRLRFENLPGAGGLLGAKALSEAPPDGSVLGIVNMPAVLMTEVTGSLRIDAVDGFTPLATVAKSGYLWATSASSDFRSIDDVIAAGQGRGLVWGVSSFSSLDFVLSSSAATMLGWSVAYVPGYLGSAERALAAIRGEVDIVALSHEVLVDRVRAGDLRPLLAISPETQELQAEFRDAAALAGPDGIVERFAPAKQPLAQALVRFMEGGRVLAGPAGLDGQLAQCLGASVCRAINDPRAASAGASRNLDVKPLCMDETVRRMRAARADARVLTPHVRDAVRQARSG